MAQINRLFIFVFVFTSRIEFKKQISAYNIFVRLKNVFLNLIYLLCAAILFSANLMSTWSCVFSYLLIYCQPDAILFSFIH